MLEELQVKLAQIKSTKNLRRFMRARKFDDKIHLYVRLLFLRLSVVLINVCRRSGSENLLGLPNSVSTPAQLIVPIQALNSELDHESHFHSSVA